MSSEKVFVKGGRGFGKIDLDDPKPYVVNESGEIEREGAIGMNPFTEMGVVTSSDGVTVDIPVVSSFLECGSLKCDGAVILIALGVYGKRDVERSKDDDVISIDLSELSKEEFNCLWVNSKKESITNKRIQFIYKDNSIVRVVLFK